MNVTWKSKTNPIFEIDGKKPRFHFHKHLSIVKECELASAIIFPKHAFGTHPQHAWLETYLRTCNRIGIPCVYKKKHPG